jgi:hypothetical protein
VLVYRAWFGALEVHAIYEDKLVGRAALGMIDAHVMRCRHCEILLVAELL